MATSGQVLINKSTVRKRDPFGAFFWLSASYLVYCARSEDWIPGLKYLPLPLAKVTGVLAFLTLLGTLRKTKRGFRDLPREARYLLVMVCLLFVSAVFSPLWRGGAFFHTLDFSKVIVAWVLTFVLVTDFEKFRRIIFIQSGSVAVIAAISTLKSRSHERLEGVLGGIYSNPNDLAFAIVLSLPFCLAFLLSTPKGLRKAGWLFFMLIMAAALFLTASRGGFVTFVVAGTICLWHFGVKGRRFYLIAVVGCVGMLLLVVAGGRLKDRWFALSDRGLETRFENSAYGSFEERRYLIIKSLEGIEHYPVLGVGMHNFGNYSGKWKDVHVAFLQIAVEGGIPVLFLYLMFFARGFSNLRKIRRMRLPDREVTLFVGALHSSLVGFVVGALFAPEAYQYFPYFIVAYTSVLLAIVEEKENPAAPATTVLSRPQRFSKVVVTDGRSGVFPHVR